MKLDKIVKKLSFAAIEELDVMVETQLQKSVAQSEEAIDQATRERDANDEYKRAKQAVKDLSEGLRDVKSYQKAKIHYALLRLREMGQGEPLSDELREELSNLRQYIESNKPKSAKKSK